MITIFALVRRHESRRRRARCLVLVVRVVTAEVVAVKRKSKPQVGSRAEQSRAKQAES